MVTNVPLIAQDLRRLGEGDRRRELVSDEVVEMAPVGGIRQLDGKTDERAARPLARMGGQGGRAQRPTPLYTLRRLDPFTIKPLIGKLEDGS